MPAKSLRQRVKRAKRSGVAPTWKESDVAAEPHPVSAHGAKKARHLVRQAQVIDRRVGRSPQPGYGGSRPKPERGPSPGAMAVVPFEHVEFVRGRKKPPSQMHVRRPGG